MPVGEESWLVLTNGIQPLPGGQAPVFPDDERVEAVVPPDRSGKAGLLQFEVATGATPAVPGDDFLRLQEGVAGSPPGWVFAILGFMTRKVRTCSVAAINRQPELLVHPVTRRHVCWIGQTGVTMSALGTTETSEERRP